MRRILSPLAIVAALLVAVPAVAAQPRASVTGPTTVPAGSLIVLDARASVSDKPIKWRLTGPDLPIVVTTPQDAPAGSLAIVFAASQPGRYIFLAIARGVPEGQSELDVDAAIWVVDVGTAPPPPVPPVPVPDKPPAPKPPPVPPTPPTPAVQGHIFVTYIADAGRMTAEQAGMKRHPTLEANLPGLDASYRWYQSDEAEVAALGFGAMVRNFTLPFAVIQDRTGKVLSVTPPGRVDPGAVVDAVRSFRGAAK